MAGEQEEEAADGAALEVGDEPILRVEDLAYGGRGVARAARRVVFVEGALPGERVRARIVKAHPAYAEAVAAEVLEPSPDRATPRCEHFGVCGGCDLQHLRPAMQARAKRAQVAGLLTRIAGIPEPHVNETVVAGEPWAYRFRMDLDWAPSASPGRGVLGMHRRARPDEIEPIHHCDLMSEDANAIVRFLSTEAAARRLQPWDPRRRSGFLRRVSIQEARATREMLVTLHTGRGEPPALVSLAADLARRVPRLVGVVRREVDREGVLVQESILVGRDHLFEEVDGDRFKVPSGAFFQPNVRVAGALRSGALEGLALRGGESILELYCGVGFLTLPLARKARVVIAVEGSREAIAAARENASRAGASSVRFVNREVSEALPDLLRAQSWDAILVDPPRVGLPRRVASAIASAGAAKLIYVSCDPATLARDLKILTQEGRLALDAVTPYDLFPQTARIECVAILTRPSSGARAGLRRTGNSRRIGS